MRALKRLFSGLTALFRPARVERELDEELQQFFEASVEAKIASGMAPEAARRAARVELGSPAAVKDWVRDVGWESRAESIWQDVRYAVRMLRRSPGFALAAIVTCTLGIATNVAIFTLADGMLFRPLPFRDPDRLVLIQGYSAARAQAYMRVDRIDFEQLRAHHSGIEAIGTAEQGSALTWIGSDGAESIGTVSATPNLFQLLGVSAHLGRALRPGDESVEPRPAMLTFRAWHARFGADPGIVGRTLDFDQGAVQIVGVLPRRFISPIPGWMTRGDLWLVEALNPSEASSPRAGVWSPVARLKRGVTLEQAQSEVDVLVRRAAQQFPETPQDRTLRAANLQFALFELNRPLLWLLLTAAGGVLLIACVNLSSLLLARGRLREREIGIRIAIGAPRWRIARQLLVESGVLGMVAGGVALCITVPLMKTAGPALPSHYLLVTPGFDVRTVGFTLLLSVLASVLFGALPALRLTSADAAEIIREPRRTGAGPLRFLKAGAPLVIAEVALCSVLLSATGLTANSLIRRRTVDLGFEHTNVLDLSFYPPRTRYPTPQHAYDFYTEVLDEIRRLPGIQAAAIDIPQLGGAMPERIQRGGAAAGVGIWRVTPNYFSTMGIQLLEGRDLSDADVRTDASVAVVGESVARRLWPDGTAIGRVLELDHYPPLTVVGIARDLRSGYGGRTRLSAYLPLTRESHRMMTILVRGEGDPAALGPMLRTIVQRKDPKMVVARPETLAETLDAGIADARFQTLLFGLFGVVGLLVAAAGIYGVMANWVGSRTRELGVHLALGAAPGRLKALVVRQASVPLALGLALGIAGALALTKRLESLLYEVTPHDPLTFVAVVLVLIAAGLLAAYGPARRAARIDPISALRAE